MFFVSLCRISLAQRHGVAQRKMLSLHFCHASAGKSTKIKIIMNQTNQSSDKISIIGSGNVAWHLAKQLFACDFTINAVYSRNLDNAKLLAEQVKAQAVNKIELIPPSDLYLFAVKDDAYRGIIDSFPKTTAVCVHTSGSLELNMLSKISDNYGVLYPFQTFSKSKSIDFQKIPICVEASNSQTENVLLSVANKLSPIVRLLNSEQRAYLHLAGVFACNFTNALYAIAEQIAKEQQIDFEIIKPLILETAHKIETLSPAEAQTGPAKRNDQTIMQKHLELLTNPQWKEIYKLLSDILLTHNYSF
jgi:predicted short-subunit dehydrogenase-like oxidoreductase (DUF2520 family)